MTEFRINLILCTKVICDEVRLGFSQKEVAKTYAMAIKSAAQGADKPDWPTINAAILARWKMSGLERIKAMAFKALTPSKTKDTGDERK